MTDVSEISGFPPGPWFVADKKFTGGAIVVSHGDPEDGGDGIADFSPCGPWVSEDVAEAAAQLAARAPDMHAEIARLRREKAALVEALKPFAELWDESEGRGYHARSIPAALFMDARAALRSANELPSVNWKNGEPYSYCPECGRQEPLRSATEKGEPT